MYTTSLKTWARAVAVDGILIAALVAGVIYHIPYALEVSVFFMWWISVLGLVFGLITCILIGVARKKYRERLGIKLPDDIEEEFAK